MDNSGAIIVAIITSVMCALGCRSAAVNGNKALRMNSKFFPKHYVIPPRWIRRFFSLPKEYMVKHRVVQLYFALVHIVLGIINVLMLLMNFSWSEFVFCCIVTGMFVGVLLDGAICGIIEYKLRHNK